MEDNKILKLVYTFFVGILLALFIGVGINTFYPQPKAPEYPAELNALMGKEPTAAQQAKQLSYEKSMKAFEEKTMQPYNRNVSIMTLIAAISLLALSILLEKKIKLIADGVMLGGLFALLYSIGRGFASANSRYVFAIVSLGLAVVLYLGYHRFVKETKAKKTS